MMAAALAAGADFVGLVFFPKSPRHVEIEQARALADMARGKALITALLVNPEDDEIGAIINALQPDYLQLHGGESPARCQHIKTLFQRPLIKAIGVSSQADARLADSYDMADIILFDTKAEPSDSDLPGGRGISFDWRALSGQKEQRDFMLAGGLTPDNVQEAIRLTGAAMVDVSSGVERSPGVKDASQIERFLRAAKATE